VKRQEFLDRFDFPGYVFSRFSSIMETSNEDRVRTMCPMCSDTTGHLYILLSAGLAYCQKCKYDPKSPIRFISDVEGIPLGEVIKRAGESFTPLDTTVEDIVSKLFDEEEDTYEYEVMSLDHNFVPVLEEIGVAPLDRVRQRAVTYLEDRGVTKEQMLRYDMRYCYDGTYAGRIVVPCFYKGDIVTFVARDLSGYSSRKYLNPTGNKQSDFLYNYDAIGTDTVVVTEGVFDAISASLVAPAVASFGKSLSERQVSFLNSVKNVIFYWDKDAYPQVEMYVKKIQGTCRVVCHADGKDAGSRTYEENKRLITSAVPLGSVEYEMFKLTELNG
jgi:DNA primase